MFAAGPGTITAVVPLAAVHTPDRLPVTAIVAAFIGAGVTLAVLLLAIGAGSQVGRGTQAIVTRFMGLIVASMGMQFVLSGLKAFWGGSDSQPRSTRQHERCDARSLNPALVGRAHRLPRREPSVCRSSDRYQQDRTPPSTLLQLSAAHDSGSSRAPSYRSTNSSIQTACTPEV